MKTLRSVPLALLVVALAVALVGSSCSAANPVALQVGSWQLSQHTLEEQMDSFAAAYATATSPDQADQALRGGNPGTWSTKFTSQFLNDQLSLQLARKAAEQRGLEITQDDRDAARNQLEQNYSTQAGDSVFGDLDQGYQDALVEGVAAQTKLEAALLADATTDEALRTIFDSSDTYTQPQACVSHILALAGQPSAGSTPTDDQYAAALTKIQGLEAGLTPATFADVAKASSDDGTAAQGGDLGCAPRNSYIQEFDDAIWSQEVGVVGPPVKTSVGYHLILVRSRGVPSFDDVKGQIAQQVAQNPELLLTAELRKVAADLDISVDGRYGQFDADTASISAPAGAEEPSTTTTAPAAGAPSDPVLSTP